MTRFPLLLLVLGVVFAGCMAPAPQARIRISTGERVLVNLRSGEVVDDPVIKEFKILISGFMISPQSKNGIYSFALLFANGVQPARVTIEDVTESKAEVLVEDDAPALENNLWRKVTPPVDLDAPSMRWMHEIDDSFRVYAFHVTLKDGRKLTVRRAAVYLGYFKAGLMNVLRPDANKP